MERLELYLFFLFILLSPSLYSLEEQSIQAKILVEDREEPALVFPLTRPDFREVKERFLLSLAHADYLLYNDPPSAPAGNADLCGFQEPDSLPPEGDVL